MSNNKIMMNDGNNTPAAITEFNRLASMYINGKISINDPEFISVLDNISNFISRSVLKKIWNKSYNNTVLEQRYSLEKAINIIATKSEDNIPVEYDYKQEVLADLLAMLNRIKANGRQVENFDLLKSFEHRTLNNRIIAQGCKRKKYKVEKTSLMRIIWKRSRRYIDSMNNKWNVSAFTYIDDYSEEDKHATDRIYYRFYKAADVGNNPNINDWKKVSNVISGLMLTARELSILRLRIGGYSEDDIADKLKCTRNAVHGACNRIRQKAIACGYSSHEILKHIDSITPVFYLLYNPTADIVYTCREKSTTISFMQMFNNMTDPPADIDYKIAHYACSVMYGKNRPYYTRKKAKFSEKFIISAYTPEGFKPVDTVYINFDFETVNYSITNNPVFEIA